jgi:hypothetical protein
MTMGLSSTEDPAVSIDFLPPAARDETNVTQGVRDQTLASPSGC